MSQKDESEAMSSGQGGIPASAVQQRRDVDPAELGNEIAKQLRALYGRHMAEPLPEKFTTLLEQLSKAERK